MPPRKTPSVAWIRMILISTLLTTYGGVLLAASEDMGGKQMQHYRVQRLGDGPIIHSGIDASIGANIQGPSLIRVPDWVANPLGRYYLYFADHKGSYIRLAFADTLTGPWRIHQPGSLQLDESNFPGERQTASPEQLAEFRKKASDYYGGTDKVPDNIMLDMTQPHIASPDVHVDSANKRIVMYFHGLERFGLQLSRVAISTDGLHFKAGEELLGRSYMRIFHYADMTYALAMPGLVYRSGDGLSGFEQGPTLFNPNMRHAGLLLQGDTLQVFWTQVGDRPERIMMSRIELADDWMSWQVSEAVDILRPERDWEGANAPLIPSVRSLAHGVVNQLRDPAIFQEEGRIYLLYAVAGESGIAIARLHSD